MKERARLLYLYALGEAIDALEGLTGVDSEPVELYDVHGVRLAAGWVTARPTVSRSALEVQDRVVRALHERSRALLPFRFGTAAHDLAAAIAAIDVISSGVAERLARVRGREQMTVRLVRRGGAIRTESTASVERGTEGAAPGEGPGARYLRARAAARQLPPHLEDMFAAVRLMVRATIFEAGHHPDMIGTVYHLIDRGGAEAYRRGLRTAAAAQPAVALRVSGPSPAYAF